MLHGGQALEREVIIDATVQEKNTTFPADAKLRVKVTGRCRKFALARCLKAVNQKRRDTNTVYSLHEPGVCCIMSEAVPDDLASIREGAERTRTAALTDMLRLLTPKRR